MRKPRIAWKCIFAFIINPTLLNGTCAICIKFTAVTDILKMDSLYVPNRQPFLG